MPTRLLLGASIGAGAAGAVVIALTLTNAITWQRAAWIAAAFLFGSLYLLGITIISLLRAFRTDLAQIRTRSKKLATNTSRLASRVEDIRQELLLGPMSHLPGQVARIEGLLPETPTLQQRRHGTPAGSHSLQTEFDSVFVLNLDRDAEKMRHVAAMLERHGIEFSRFPAVDGTAAEFDEEWDRYCATKPDLPPERYTGTKLIESRGAWGYLKTMQALLHEAGTQGLERILIFDDDVMLHREFGRRFTQTWPELPADWKLVYLGSAQVDRAKLSSYSTRLRHPGAMANGSYAIALDASVFAQALAAIDRFDWPFDAGALREIDVAFPSKVFTVEPPLVVADVSASSIRSGRDLGAHTEKHGWDLKDYETSWTAAP